MCAAIALGDVVGKAVDVLLKSIVPLHGDFHRDTVFALAIKMENAVDRGLVGIQMLDKGAQATFVLEDFFLARTLVGQTNAHATVQERELTQTLGENVVVEFNVGKGFRRGNEMHLGTRCVSLADGCQRCIGNTVGVGLLVNLVVSTNGQGEGRGQCVHHRDAHAVKTAGHLVGVIVELTAGVQHGHDNFRSRNAFLFVEVHRNATAVVLHGYRFVRVDNHTNL